jgi:hypothetical protein
VLPPNIDRRGRTTMWEDVMKSLFSKSELDIVRVSSKIFEAMQCYAYFSDNQGYSKV